MVTITYELSQMVTAERRRQAMAARLAREVRRSQGAGLRREGPKTEQSSRKARPRFGKWLIRKTVRT